jgi:lipopolysaccharide biosynthesis protein
VPRRRFEEVGGFTGDLGTPAYERCDLQLKLRAIGLRTIYRPEAVVHLLEDGSAASPADPGLERRAVARSAQRMRERWGDVVDAMEAVRLIAFYLPQFHPIRENEFWWGKGFTEWTNVAKAQPCFVGHEQPHLPTELGFYDLRIPEVMHEQARLAQAYGISGFCYYYYWFDGKRLLEAPTERLLSEVPAALPFCLCWANENWTRRWDGGGGESEILMGQAHSDEDDEAVIRDLIRFLRHPSYIRVNGRPMLLVYRVGLFPDIRRTAALWRDACRREGLGEIHLVRVDSFEEATRATPPSHHGFDAAVEFPPHQIAAVPVQSAELLRPAFAGKILEYEEVVLQSVDYKDAGYPHYRTVLSRWDNTPRRQDAATIYANSSPGAYQAYLEEVLAYTREHSVGDDRVVFVNAWNEWAEGAHLEPDRRYGRTYLEATANAMAEHLVRRGVGGP